MEDTAPKVEYKLIMDTSTNKLNAEVNSYLEKGWVLYGSPIVTSDALDALHNYYSQAIKRYY